MGIAFTVTHDCHQAGAVCTASCWPIAPSAPVDTCPKTHKVMER